MEGLTTLAWGSYVAAPVMALGLVLAFRGLRHCRIALPRPGSASMHSLTWMRGFRLTLFGLAVAGVGAAWLWQIEWLLFLSLAIGGEETLETSIAISALRAPAASIPGGRVALRSRQLDAATPAVPAGVPAR
jgi:hypothetical protein